MDKGSIEVRQVPGMTVSAIAQAVRERATDTREPGWKTTTEIATESGVSHSAAECALARLVRDGKAERRRALVSIGGAMRNCYVYRLVDGG